MSIMKVGLASAIALLACVAEAHAAADPCSGRYDGTWAYKEGRSMSVAVNRTSGQAVTVVITTRNGTDSLRGTCVTNAAGVARLKFRHEPNFGDLKLEPNGRATGIISNFEFNGLKAESAPRRPEPAVDPCEGDIFGRWGYPRDERGLRILLRRTGFETVQVTMLHAGFTEIGNGICRTNPEVGSGQLSFRTPWNGGRLSIDSQGFVRGQISNLPFYGEHR